MTDTALRFSSVRGPNQDRWDFSLIKNFRITERVTTQFRAETFNALNHPTLYDPNTASNQRCMGYHYRSGHAPFLTNVLKIGLVTLKPNYEKFKPAL